MTPSSSMPFQEQLWELIRAGFSGIYVESHEPSEALLELSSLAAEKSLQLLVWNLDSGLRSVGGELGLADDAADPLTALKCLDSLHTDQSVVLVLENFHRFLGSIEVVQALQTRLQAGKQVGWHVIVLSPEVVLPSELERQFVVLSQASPDASELWEIAESLVEDPDLYPGAQRELLQAASAGLTKLQAESAYSLSLVRHGRIITDEIWSLKAQWLAKSGFLELARGGSDFDSLGGLENLKRFCFRSLDSRAEATVRPKGVLLLGVPGTGKSAFAKALGAEVSRPVLSLDIGRLMGSLIGQTEANVRQALWTADAMAPCILFIDEVEKALAGASGQSAGDSGVASRLFGTLLTWLNDHESDVYVIATCNDIRRLPPEFSRAERFDAVMFLDLPAEAEKAAIWELYEQSYGLSGRQRPDDTDWTGAEIKACCRLACLMSVSLIEAAEFIVPVGRTASESVERLRQWASGRCISASAPGIYQHQAAPTKRRSINTTPSNN